DNAAEYHFIGGYTSSLEALKLIEMERFDNFHKVKNRWFLRHFLWQSGIFKIVNRDKLNAVIVFADWKYISLWSLIWYLNFKKIPVLFWSHGILTTQNTLNNRIKLFFFNQFKYGGFVYDTRAKNLMEAKDYNKQ